jgi:probable HAF family extracellular repeat protein
MQDLGTLPGGVFSSATAVSADGTIVAGVSNGGGNSAFAFRWTQATSMQKLSDLLAAHGIQPGAGMALTTTDFMSDDGKITVGSLTGPSGWVGYYIARC